MTTEQKIQMLTHEIQALKARLDRIVPLDDDGEYRPAFLRKIARARASKVRLSFKGGVFSHIR